MKTCLTKREVRKDVKKINVEEEKKDQVDIDAGLTRPGV